MHALLLRVTHAATFVVAPAFAEHPNDPIAAATDLLQRVVPAALVPHFKLELLPRTAGPDIDLMQLDSDGNHVILRGTGAVELASALNWYMNDYLNVTYDWNTYASGQWFGAGKYAADAAASRDDDVVIPLPPSAAAPVRPRQLPLSYYMNVCTPGYSLAFVDWEYWSKHIDWMALNGINLPLAFTGQEWLWREVFTSSQFNLTAKDLDSFFSGPAFLPWFRMGNMRGWGGPLAADWIDSRKALQLQIVARQRGLGMRPVLGGFAGHVPAAFAKNFPHAAVTRSPSWARFEEAYGEVYLLSADDPLFKAIGAAFITVQAKTYGTDHIYQCDEFNEMSPASGDHTALAKSSSAVFGGMVAADKDAIWLMQGWLFQSSWWTTNKGSIEAYLSGVPNVVHPLHDSGMWILDLFGTSKPVWSRTSSFFGKPYILCTLLNFGGQQGIFGSTTAVVTEVQKAITTKGSTVIGVGITMEGIWTNYPVFEIALAQSWSPKPNATRRTTYGAPIASAFQEDFYSRYPIRRYGAEAPGAVAAWKEGLWQVYRDGTASCGPGSAISSVPSLHGPPVPEPSAPAGFKTYKRRGYWGTPAIAATTTLANCASMCAAKTTCAAFEIYIDTPPPYTGSHCYLFDLIDLTRPFTDLAPCATYVKDGLIIAPSTMSELHSALAPGSAATRERRRLGLPDPVVNWTNPATSALKSFWLASTQRDASGNTASSSPFAVAWTNLLEAKTQLGSSGAYRFDLIDVARCVIASNFSATLNAYEAAFGAGNRTTTTSLATTLLGIMDDYDMLLSTDVNFMLGRWIAWARNATGPSASVAAQDLYEFNARNQITLWGPHGEINDYARKEWGGLVRSYYKKRYSLLFTMADNALKSKSTWSQAAYDAAVMEQVELPWSNATDPFPNVPEHDLLNIIDGLHVKYVL